MVGVAAWDLPSDCRNQTVEEEGGLLPLMSYHIHYVRNSSASSDKKEMKRFYEAFVAKFSDKFQSDILCPFGPNYPTYSSDTFPSKTVCSLERALGDELAVGVDVQGNPWGHLYQRAFFIPKEFIDDTWEWSKENRGAVDIVKHTNTGCQHDDHSVRALWEGASHSLPTLEFPCNMPGTGCYDSDYSGPPSCATCCEIPGFDAFVVHQCSAVGQIVPYDARAQKKWHLFSHIWCS